MVLGLMRRLMRCLLKHFGWKKIANKISSEKSHYEVLGVKKTANKIEIKRAYRKIALRQCPDKNMAKEVVDMFTPLKI